jgi:hypothetical protein
MSFGYSGARLSSDSFGERMAELWRFPLLEIGGYALATKPLQIIAAVAAPECGDSGLRFSAKFTHK